MDSSVKYHEAPSLNDSGSLLRRLGPSLPWRFLTGTKPELQQPIICAPKNFGQNQHQVQLSTEFEQNQEKVPETAAAAAGEQMQFEDTPVPRKQLPTPTPGHACPHHPAHHANTCVHNSNTPCCHHQQMVVQCGKQLIDAAVSPIYEAVQDQSIQADTRYSQSVEIQVGEIDEAPEEMPQNSIPAPQTQQTSLSKKILFQDDDNNDTTSVQLDGSHLFQHSLQKLDKIIKEAAVDLRSAVIKGQSSNAGLQNLQAQHRGQAANIGNESSPGKTHYKNFHHVSQVMNEQVQPKNQEAPLSPISSFSSFAGNLSPVAETTDSLEELEKIIEEQHQQLVARGILASTEELASSSSWTEDWYDVQHKKFIQSQQQVGSINNYPQLSSDDLGKEEEIQVAPTTNSCLSPIQEDVHFAEFSNSSMCKKAYSEDNIYSIKSSAAPQFSVNNNNNSNNGQYDELPNKTISQSSLGSLQNHGDEIWKTSYCSDSVEEDDAHLDDDYIDDLESSRKQDTDLTKHAEALSCKIKSLLKQLQQEQTP